MKYLGVAIMCVLATSAAHATAVLNPVATPIAPGVKAGLSLFGQAQASGDAAVDGFRTRIQTLQPVKDASGRLFVNDTRGTISIVGAAGGTPQTWFDIRGAVAGFSNASNPGQTGLMGFALHPNFAGNPKLLVPSATGKLGCRRKPRLYIKLSIKVVFLSFC